MGSKTTLHFPRKMQGGPSLLEEQGSILPITGNVERQSFRSHTVSDSSIEMAVVPLTSATAKLLNATLCVIRDSMRA
jgi:hypothetical protein